MVESPFASLARTSAASSGGEARLGLDPEGPRAGGKGSRGGRAGGRPTGTRRCTKRYPGATPTSCACSPRRGQTGPSKTTKGAPPGCRPAREVSETGCMKQGPGLCGPPENRSVTGKEAAGRVGARERHGRWGAGRGRGGGEGRRVSMFCAPPLPAVCSVQLPAVCSGSRPAAPQTERQNQDAEGNGAGAKLPGRRGEGGGGGGRR